MRLAVSGDIVEQFPVNSRHSINEGDAKPGDFDDDEWEDDEQTTGTGYDLWTE
ncbi:MAG: transcriptional regulator [Hoylesella marshii]|uniref:transcriptional regulator n=1 Tax=Hoylesella marshii TaxID=189722 RepID=UPI003FA07F41